LDGVVIARDLFGASAPFKEILNQFGFTSANVYNSAKSLLS
jgi:transketolase